jgi:hypothetical protein
MFSDGNVDFGNSSITEKNDLRSYVILAFTDVAKGFIAPARLVSSILESKTDLVSSDRQVNDVDRLENMYVLQKKAIGVAGNVLCTFLLGSYNPDLFAASVTIQAMLSYADGCNHAINYLDPSKVNSVKAR